jgi:hypothetical protein
VALVEHADGVVEQHLLVVGGRLRAKQRDQRGDHGVPAAAGVGDHLGARLAGESVSRDDRLAGIEDVEPAAARMSSDIAATITAL